jgi:hypothetical protein
MSRHRTGHLLWVGLISILLLAALLRLLSIDHGLPHVVGVDEGFEVHRALRLGAGEFDFDRDGKGGFFYLLFLCYGAYFAGLLVTGGVGGPDDFARMFATDLTPFWTIGRVTHALLAVLTVYWTYRLGRRLYGNWVGLFGAATLAVSLLHVSGSRYIGVDIPMVLLVVVLLELAHRWADSSQRARPVLFGVVFGFAVMTKIVAIATLVPIALANWLRHRDEPLGRRLLDRKIFAVYTIGAIVFMVGNPGFVVNMGQFFSDALSAFAGTDAGGSDAPGGGGGETPNLWLFYTRVLSDDLGFALFALAAAGLVLALLRRTHADLLLAATVAVFFVLIAGVRSSHLYYARYAIPLVPLLALLAGRLLAAVTRRLPAPERFGAPAMAAATLVLLLPGAARSWDHARIHTREDSRVVARLWLERHAEPEAPVFLIGNPIVHTAPNLSVPLRNTDANVDRLIAELRESEPSKARILELRKETDSGVAFDLRPVRHFEPNRSLDVYLSEGVRYFALVEDHFGDWRLASDTKHADQVVASRRALASACRNDPRVRRVFAVDPDIDKLAGPAVEIFGVTP